MGVQLPKALPVEVWASLFAAARAERRYAGAAERDVAVLVLGFFAGCRSFESCALELLDVNLDVPGGESGVIHIRRGKGKKERFAALAPEGVSLLREYLGVRGLAPGPFLCSRKGGSLSTSAVRRLMLRIAKRTEIAAARSHGLRHSHITQAVVRAMVEGLSLYDVADQAGHRDLRTTRLYYQADPGTRQQLVKGISTHAKS